MWWKRELNFELTIVKIADISIIEISYSSVGCHILNNLLVKCLKLMTCVSKLGARGRE